MKTFKTWTFFLLKYKTRKKSFLAMLICIPILCVIIGNISLSDTNSEVFVSVFARSDDEMSMAVINNLTSMDGKHKFILAKSEAEVREKVKHAKVQCGYILKRNQIQLAHEGIADDNIILVERMGSAKTDIVNEVFYGVYFKEFSKHYSQNFISNANGDNSDTTTEKFEKSFDEQIDTMMSNFSVEKVTIEKPVTNEDYVRNILAIIICLFGFARVGQFASDNESGLLFPVPAEKRLLFRILYFGVELLLLAPVLFLGLLLQKSHKFFIYEAGAIIMYLLLITIMCVFCSYIFKKKLTVMCILPVLTIVYIIVCPVFFSLASYFPIIDKLRYLCVPYYYLRLF